MNTSVRTKPSKKAADSLHLHPRQQALETALVRLEDVLFDVLDADVYDTGGDPEAFYWDRLLKNIATPISLAIGECRGEQRFHYHYRHDPKNPDTLLPVMEPSPYTTLSKVCDQALAKLDALNGMHGSPMNKRKVSLEHAMQELQAALD